MMLAIAIVALLLFARAHKWVMGFEPIRLADYQAAWPREEWHRVAESDDVALVVESVAHLVDGPDDDLDRIRTTRVPDFRSSHAVAGL